MKHIVFGIGIFCIAAVASADTAFNNFGPSMAYNTLHGDRVSGSGSSNGYIETAMQFTSLVSGSLESITTGLVDLSTSGMGDSMTLNLYTDNGSNGFGALLYSDHYDPGLSMTSQLSSVMNSNALITLTAGQKYWVDMVADTDTNIGWNYDYQNTANQLVYQWSTPGGTPRQGSTDVSLQVTTQSVPEPASIAALGLGLIGLLKGKRF